MQTSTNKIKVLLKWSFFSLAILFSETVFPQEGQYLPPKFQNLNLKDGLSNLNVLSICQDDLGYIWMGTARGLNRYDGTSFKYYFYNEDGHSLCHDLVSCLYINQDKKVFCSTSFGVNLFDPFKGEMSRLNSNNENFVGFADYKGITYASSLQGGLFIYNKENQSLDKLPDFPREIILDKLITDENTGLWARTPDNMFLINYNPGQKAYKKYPLPLKRESYLSGAIVKVRNKLLIATDSKLLLFDLDSKTFSGIPAQWDKILEVEDKAINFINEVEKNILWIGTTRNGLYIYNLNSNSFLHFDKSNSELKSNYISSLFKDRDNNIWLGTFDQGVEISFDRRKNFNFDLKLNDLTSNKFVTSIETNNKGTYFIGTRSEGLFIYDSKNKTSKTLNSENSFLKYNHVRTLYLDSKNKLWIATEKYLQILDLNTQKDKLIDLQPNKGFVCFCEYDGKILAGSDIIGLLVFNEHGELLKNITKLGRNITQILYIGNGNFAISSYGSGFYIYNLENDSVIDYKESIPYSQKKLNEIITMYIDSDNMLWIGNFKYGLYRLDMKKDEFSVFTMDDGLPSNDITGIVEDRAGKLWISTAYGLSHFNKKDEFINYFYNEGLQNIQFHQKAALIDQDGTIFLGGNYGLTFFDPKALDLKKKEAPKIILASLSVMNKEIQSDDETHILSQILNNTPEITLNYKQKTFSIDYHAFDYIAADKIRYAYQLSEFDTQWNNVGERTNANFSNLRPGTYTFRVKAQNTNGAWSEPSVLKINIKPSPYQTKLAFLIYFLLLSGILYISFKLILNAKLYKSKLLTEHNERLREKEIAQMKSRFFTNISHELRTPVTLIKGNVDLLSKELAAQRIQIPSLKGLQYSCDRLLRLINQLLSFRRLENDALGLNIKKDDIIRITRDLCKSFEYVALSRAISIKLESDFDTLTFPFDQDKYEKIISNLLANSLKFAKPNGIIKIKIEMLGEAGLADFLPGVPPKGQPDYLKISVTDNGGGISKQDLPNIFSRYMQSESNLGKPDYSGTGIGLNFTKRLVELHHGAIKVSSTENVETTFSFILPLDETIYSNDIWLSSESGLNEPQEEEAKQVIKPSIPAAEKGLILVVEDDLELNKFISSFLKNQYKVISCYNGDEALKLALDHIPDIIISDIMMPKVDGLALCKLVREDKLISHIPIILLTAKSEVEDRISGYQYGADDYISKPFELDLLLARIENLINLRKKIQESFKQGTLISEHAEYSNQFELNFLKKVEAIISEEFQSPDFNVNLLAERINMSRTNFYKKFMSILDISPKDFITKYRINKAIEFMKNGNYNFGEISYLCGFSSQSIFSVCFKKEKGISPLQFKKDLESGGKASPEPES